MEALILIVGELILAVLVPLLATIVNVIGAMLASIFSIVPHVGEKRLISRGAAKKIFVLLLTTALIILSALFVIDKFFFADSVRMVFGTLERRSGVETSCVEIDGSVFSGRISLGKCTVVRREHANVEFNLELNTLDFQLQLSSLLGTANVQTAHIGGLRGSVNRHQVQANSGGNDALEKPRRPFVIQDLRMENVEITLSGVNRDGDSFELPVQVISATSAPLRSRFALFDILFRSNATGEIAGAEFEIKTDGDSDGRHTTWRASQVPVANFGSMVGGALSWLHDGVVDVYVEDRWRRDGQLEVDMDWRLDFWDIEVQVPATAGVVKRLASGPIVDYVNSHNGEFPFEFQMTVNENQFEYRSSLEAAGLWSAVGDSINNVLTYVGVEVDGTASETGEKLKEGARSVIDRLRKPKEKEEDE